MSTREHWDEVHRSNSPERRKDDEAREDEEGRVNRAFLTSPLPSSYIADGR